MQVEPEAWGLSSHPFALCLIGSPLCSSIQQSPTWQAGFPLAGEMGEALEKLPGATKKADSPPAASWNCSARMALNGIFPRLLE